MSTTTTAPHVITEASAWLRGTGGAQLRRVRRLFPALDEPDAPMFLAPLVGRLTERGAEDDRRCDRCGRYCGPGEMFWPFVFWPDRRVGLVGGLCDAHAAGEGVRGR